MDRSVFSFHILRGPFSLLLGLMLLLAGAAQCRTLYDTPGEFRESRKRIEKGQGAEEAAIIMRDFKKIPAQYQDEAVDNLAAIEGDVGQKSLITLLEDPRVRDDEMRSTIATRLVERDEEGSLEALLVACQNRPKLLNAEVIKYFGEKKYKPAIPLLQKKIEGGELVNESVGALIQMQDPAANLFLLTLAMGADQPEAVRVQVLTAVEELAKDDEGLRTKAVPVYEGIVNNYQEEPRPVLDLAIRGLQLYGKPDTSFEVLRRVYENAEDAELRASALLAMAELRGVSPDEIEKDFQTALVDTEAEMERLRREKQEAGQENQSDTTATKKSERTQRKTVTKTKKTNSKKSAYDNNYRGKVAKRLDETFGPDLSSEMQSNINNALLSYADWSDDDAKVRFILRSYRKHFGGDDAEQRTRLKDGLGYPGSLTVIVRNIIDEYKNDALRAYAMSEFFGIKRWQASILLDLVRAGRL